MSEGVGVEREHGEGDVGESARTRLLRAAEATLILEGVHALTIRRVAERAGSNSALVGYYFGGVAGLLAELARLNGEPIARAQGELARAAVERPTLDRLLTALVRPLWREAAFTPGERALVVIDEIVRHGEPALRELVLSWFQEPVAVLIDGFEACLPQLGRATLAMRLRFLSAAALDIGPRHSRGAVTAAEGAPAPESEEERYRQFFEFARGALGASAAS